MPKTIFTPEKILRAYLNCRQRKRRTLSALGFECELEDNLARLTLALQNRSYRPNRSVYFVVTKPKPREIFAAEFVDRITHHVLINEVEKIWEQKIFSPYSCACRRGRGHHYAMRCLSRLAQHLSYYGQFDLSNFFSSIDKHILFELFAKVIKAQAKPAWWQDDILWLAELIIFSDPTQDFFYKGDPQLKTLVPQQKSLFSQEKDIGMPIGNLSSQFLANVYLHELDHYVLDVLRLPGFVRYVDDFVILSNSKQEILQARKKIQAFLSSKLHMTMHPKKQQIQPVRHGIPFVGYFVKPSGVMVRKNVVKTLKNQLYHCSRYKQLDEKQLVASLNSYYGHLRQARSYRLRRHLYQKHLPKRLQRRLRVVGQWQYFKLAPRAATRRLKAL